MRAPIFSRASSTGPHDVSCHFRSKDSLIGRNPPSSGCVCAHPTLPREPLRGRVTFDDVTSGSHVGHAQWYVWYYYYSKKKKTREPVAHAQNILLVRWLPVKSFPVKVASGSSSSNATLAVLIYYLYCFNIADIYGIRQLWRPRQTLPLLYSSVSNRTSCHTSDNVCRDLQNWRYCFNQYTSWHIQKSWVVCSFAYPRWRFLQARNFYKDFLKKYFDRGCGHFSEVKYLTLHR